MGPFCIDIKFDGVGAATVLWFMFLYLGHEDRFNYHEMYGDGALSAFGFGLAAIWLLKFILGTFVDKKED